MHDSVLIKNFAPAMATPISKKGACGTKCFISSDNKRQILFENIDFIAKRHFINKVFILGKFILKKLKDCIIFHNGISNIKSNTYLLD